VWKRSGSSSTIRYWLKLKPPGTTVTGVEIRWIEGATSSMRVPL